MQRAVVVAVRPKTVTHLAPRQHHRRRPSEHGSFSRPPEFRVRDDLGWGPVSTHF